MNKREFITLLGGVAVAWPLAGRAQNVNMRRVIVLMGTADDAEAKDRAVALQEGLQKLRWTVGRDLQINYLFAAGNAERLLAYANEAVASKPDILLAQTNPAVKAVQNVTRTLPIVFLQVSDPVGAGFVRSLSHPGGNITGFTNFEAEIGGKWLQTLKDIAPAVVSPRYSRRPPRARVRASWGLSGRRGNFCREAPDGLSLAQSSPCRARTSGKPPAARRNGWLVARADRKSSLLPLASGRTFLNRVRDPFISAPNTKTP
jgi:hypothetical protein